MPIPPELHAEIVGIVKAALKEALPPQWMTTEQAATYINVSTQYLTIGRSKGNKMGNEQLPAYCKRGRIVRYKLADLDAWLEIKKIALETLSGEAA